MKYTVQCNIVCETLHKVDISYWEYVDVTGERSAVVMRAECAALGWLVNHE